MVKLSTSAHPAAAANAAAASISQSVPAAANATPANARNWTRDKMLNFIQILAESCSVTTAAKCVGMSRQSAYRLRARLVRQPFDLAWEAALEFGMQQLAHSALDRAMNGVPVPVFYRGEQVGEKRVFNERAALNLMLAAQHIGRNHYARDWATRNWTDLLERMGDGPLLWTDEEQASADPDHPLNQEACSDEEEEYETEETHAVELAEQAKLAGQSFIEKQSHYGPVPDNRVLDGRKPRVRIL